MTEYIYPARFMTVIIRDDAPMIHCGDSPSYRTVKIELTDEQIGRIKLKNTSTSGGNKYYEEISRCILETE